MDGRARTFYEKLWQRLLLVLFAFAVVGALFVEALRTAAPVPAPIYHRRPARSRRVGTSEVNCGRPASFACANGN